MSRFELGSGLQVRNSQLRNVVASFRGHMVGFGPGLHDFQRANRALETNSAGQSRYLEERPDRVTALVAISATTVRSNPCAPRGCRWSGPRRCGGAAPSTCLGPERHARCWWPTARAVRAHGRGVGSCSACSSTRRGPQTSSGMVPRSNGSQVLTNDLLSVASHAAARASVPTSPTLPCGMPQRRSACSSSAAPAPNSAAARPAGSPPPARC